MERTSPKPKISFSHFIEKFPEVELPIILAEEAHLAFSSQNDPLPPLLIDQFILPLEVQLADDYTEFVPCMRIPETANFHALIYWRAGLLNYQYTLATFTKDGQLIDKRIIAETFSDGQVVTTSVASIDEDWIIYVVSGRAGDAPGAYDPSDSAAQRLELLPDGKIIQHDSAA
jgi:hypothetical protein